LRRLIDGLFGCPVAPNSRAVEYVSAKGDGPLSIYNMSGEAMEGEVTE